MASRPSKSRKEAELRRAANAARLTVRDLKVLWVAAWQKDFAAQVRVNQLLCEHPKLKTVFRAFDDEYRLNYPRPTGRGKTISTAMREDALRPSWDTVGQGGYVRTLSGGLPSLGKRR